MSTTAAEIKIEDSRARKGFWGVWLGDKPCGRIREGAGGKFHAFTNKRAPGKALLGEFGGLEAAADAVVAPHR